MSKQQFHDASSHLYAAAAKQAKRTPDEGAHLYAVIARAIDAITEAVETQELR